MGSRVLDADLWRIAKQSSVKSMIRYAAWTSPHAVAGDGSALILHAAPGLPAWAFDLNSEDNRANQGASAPAKRVPSKSRTIPTRLEAIEAHFCSAVAQSPRAS